MLYIFYSFGVEQDCFVLSPPEVLLGSRALLRGFAYADAAKSLREAYADLLSCLWMESPRESTRRQF